MEFLNKHNRGYLGSILSQFGQNIRSNIEISHNMEDFKALEVFLKFADFCTVSIHGLLGAVLILVDLVDDH